MEQQSTKTSKTERNPVYLGIVSLLTDVHSEIILALLPTFLAVQLGLPKQLIGLIDGLSEGASSALKLASGWLSDRLGKRKGLVVTGYSFSWLAKTLLSFATLGWQVLTLRFFDRVGKGIRSAPRDALIADSVPAERRAASFGLHRMMDTTGAVIGSLLGFALLTSFKGDFRYRDTFLVAAGLGVLAVLAAFLLVREVPGKAEPKAENHTSTVARAARARAVTQYAAVTGLFAFCDFSYMFFILRAVEMGVPEHFGPLVYAFSNVIYMITPLPAGKLADKIGRKSLLLGAFLGLAAVSLGFALTTGVLWAWVLMGLYGGQKGVSETVSRTIASELGVQKARGTPLGVFHAVQGVAIMASSVLAGTLWDHFGTGQVAFFVSAGAGLVAALLGLVLVPSRRWD